MTAFFVVTIAIISLGALYELYCALQRNGVRPSVWSGTLAVIALFVVAGIDAPLLALMGVVNVYILISLAQHLARKDRAGALTDWAFSLSAVLYVGLTMVHFVLLLRIEGPVATSWLADVDRIIGSGGTAIGLAWLCVTLAATWTTEAVMAVARRVRGRDRIRIGVLSALAAGTAIGGLSGYLIGLPASLAIMFLVGGMIAIGAILGQCCESMLARQLGMSAAVRYVPGRGGFLDRIATLRVTVPLTFYMASFLQWRI